MLNYIKYIKLQYLFIDKAYESKIIQIRGNYFPVRH